MRLNDWCQLYDTSEKLVITVRLEGRLNFGFTLIFLKIGITRQRIAQKVIHLALPNKEI